MAGAAAKAAKQEQWLNIPIILPRRIKKSVRMKKMRRVLDPSQIGLDSERLSDSLYRLIVGQDEAIDQIVNVFSTHHAGLSVPGHPVASFLFLGPTGSGKTRTVEATAKTLLPASASIVKIDCAEFQHSHEIAKLIGSPPGYLGHKETIPAITQNALDGQFVDSEVHLSFVLFDEIEKASDALWNLLLGILDKATLTLGDNRRVDFSQTLIFLTSNLGTREMNNLIAPHLGFDAIVRPDHSDASTVDKTTQVKLSKAGVEAARRKFTPEFMNRLDKIVVFHSLDHASLSRILDIELGIVQDRILRSSNGEFIVTSTDAAKNLLLEQGTDTRYGARHLKRAIERLLVQPISALISSHQISPGDWIEADVAASGTGLQFSCEGSDLDIASLAVISRKNIGLSAAAAA
jgi:ATP-dependent Clp protease ATP-binding subunit ClpB